LINAGILPLRDKDLPKMFIRTWNEIDDDKFMKLNNDKSFWRYNDEIIIQYVIDHEYNFIDKKQDKRFLQKEWLNRFEPDDSVLVSFRGWKRLKNDINDRVCFKHITGNIKRFKKEHEKINGNEI